MLILITNIIKIIIILNGFYLKQNKKRKYQLNAKIREMNENKIINS